MGDLAIPDDFDDPDDFQQQDDDLTDQIAQVAGELATLKAEARQMLAEQQQDPGTGTSIELASGEGLARKAKDRMAHLHKEVVQRNKQITEKKEQLRNLVQQQQQLADQVLQPLQAMAKRLQDSIWAINLYLGRDEEIFTLCEGEAAPADTPITIRQLVLAMDQECAVAAEQGGIDSISMGGFDEWLRADPAHLTQVAPEPKCIVALVPRYDSKHHDDPWRNMAAAEGNKQTYILVRNGSKAWRLCPDMIVGDRLVPGNTEFTDMFVEREWDHETHSYIHRPISPDSYRWQQAAERADARQRHYMRVALVLQGILDRTPMMQPMPPGISLISPDSYDQGLVQVVTDAAEHSLGDGSLRFQDWQEQTNAQLRPGMRIVGFFNSYRRDGEKTRVWPANARLPESDMIYTLDRREADGGLTFHYKRTDKIWGADYGPARLPKTSASYTFYTGATHILAFDFLNPADIDRWLRSRLDRAQYLSMFPTLKSAKAAIYAEVEAERPFRLLLAGQLMAKADLDAETAEAAVPSLVRWYKINNSHHRALVSDNPAEQIKAIELILGEQARRAKAANLSDDPDILDRLRQDHSEAVAIGRAADGRWVVVVPDRSDEHVWATEHWYTKTGMPQPARPWMLSGPRSKRWRIVWALDRWRMHWDMNATRRGHLSDPEIERLVERLRVETKAGHLVLSIGLDYKTNEDGKFRIWGLTDQIRVDPLRPITGDNKAPEIRCWSRDWSRDGTGQAQLGDHHGYPHSFSTEMKTGTWPLLPGRHPNPHYDWHHQRVVWVDEQAVSVAFEQLEVWKQHSQQAAAIHQQVEDLWAGVHDWWTKQELAVHYRKFIEDYQDDDLWEAQRKTIRLGEFPKVVYQRGAHLDMLATLIEAGYDLAGMTAGEVWALYEKQIGPAPLPLPDQLVDYHLPK